MHLNPRWLVVAIFLTIGLVWSGGHAAWLIALGVWTLVGILASPAR